MHLDPEWGFSLSLLNLSAVLARITRMSKPDGRDLSRSTSDGFILGRPSHDHVSSHTTKSWHSEVTKGWQSEVSQYPSDGEASKSYASCSKCVESTSLAAVNHNISLCESREE